MAVAQVFASLALSTRDVCSISPARNCSISRLPTSCLARKGTTFASGCPLLISRTSYQRKDESSTLVSIRCEQSTQKSNSLDVWLGRSAMVGFAVAITVEMATGKGLLEIANVESKFASAISETGEIKVEGCVKDGIPHLTKVRSFEVDVSLEGSIILCRQVDQPGMIGKVGSILAEENVNVSFMSVGRIAPRKQAVMAIGVDEPPSKESLEKIGDIPAIEEFIFLKL